MRSKCDHRRFPFDAKLVFIYCEIIVIKLFKLTTMIFTFSFVFTWIVVLSNTAEGAAKKTVEFILVVHIWFYKRKKKEKPNAQRMSEFILIEFVSNLSNWTFSRFSIWLLCIQFVVLLDSNRKQFSQIMRPIHNDLVHNTSCALHSCAIRF